MLKIKSFLLEEGKHGQSAAKQVPFSLFVSFFSDKHVFAPTASTPVICNAIVLRYILFLTKARNYYNVLLMPTISEPISVCITINVMSKNLP